MKRKKTVSYRKHQERKRKIAGMKVIGIDPAKEKHQVTVLDEHGMQMGNSFSINASHKGFNEDLCKRLRKILGKFWKEEVVFAIESSCDLWRVFAGGEDKVFKTADQKEELPEEHICSIINTYKNTDGIDKRETHH